jgi:hypothetical protein
MKRRNLLRSIGMLSLLPRCSDGLFSPTNVAKAARPRSQKRVRTGQPAWEPQVGLGSQEIDDIENAVGDGRGGLFGISSDPRSQSNEVSDRTWGPNNGQRGDFLSPGFPQDLSHCATFSCLTACP